MIRRSQSSRFTESEAHDQSRKLLSLGASVGAQREDAEDAMQEAWVAVLSRDPAGIRDTGAWMKATMMHLLIRSKERARNRAFREESVAHEGSTPSTLDTLARQSQRDYLLELFDSLGDPYREVLRLRYLHGLEPIAIAAQLERSEGTVRSQLKRGLDRVRLRHGERDQRSVFVLLGTLARRAGHVLLPRGAWKLGALLGAAVLAVVVGVLSLGTSSVEQGLREQPVAGLELPRAAPLGGRVPNAATNRRSLSPDARPPSMTRSDPIAIVATRLLGGTERVAGVPLYSSKGPDGADRKRVGTGDTQGAVQLSMEELPAWVWWESPNYLSQRQFLSADLAEPSAHLRVFPIHEIALTVLASDGPVPNATVRAIRRSTLGESTVEPGQLPAMPSSSLTDDRGMARIGRLPGPLATWLAIESPEHAPSFLHVEPDQRHVRWTLDPPASVSVAVRTPDGRVAAGATVSIELPFPAMTRTVVTDSDGRATVERLPHGPFLLMVTQAGASASVAGESSGPVSLGTLHLSEDRTLAGRVVGSRERELRVHLTPTDTVRADGSAPFLGAPGMGAEIGAVAVDGSFQFVPCLRSSYEVIVRELGSNLVLARVADARPGGPPIVLRCSNPGVESRVIGELAGLPAGGLLALRSSADPQTRLPVQVEGQSFRSAPVRPGRYRLMLDDGAGERAIAMLDLPPGSTDVGLVAWPQTGEVLLQGPDLAACSVSLSSPGWERTWTLGSSDAWSLEAESARLSDVPPGVHDLLVERGRAVYRGTITVDPDVVAEVRVQLEAERRFSLRVASDRVLYPDEELTLDVLGSDGEALESVLARADRLTHDPLAIWSLRSSVPYEAISLRVTSSHGLRGEASLAEAKSAPLRQFAPVELHLTPAR